MNKKINDFLDEMMELNDLPGLTVGVSIGRPDDGGTSGAYEFAGARGFRDMNAGTPLRPDDIFHCASVSKLFTSSAIMKLVEADAFGLYDRLCDILPSLKISDSRFAEIRLWNLLTHTSGLGDVDDYYWNMPETGKDALENYVYGLTEAGASEVTDNPMLWTPQLSPEFYGVPETDDDGNPLMDESGNPACLFRYSNVAYEILGQIVAEYSDRIATGDPANETGTRLSYEDFVAEYLLKPAGMNNSTMKTFTRCDYNNPDERELHGMASPHAKAEDRSIIPVRFYPYNRSHGPSSTLTSNIPDLLKWGRAHIAASKSAWKFCDSDMCHHDCSDPILKQSTYDSIWRNYATVPNNGEKMGLGWFIRRQKIKAGPAGNSTIEKAGLPAGDTKECASFVTLYGHEGTDDGFRASFWMCPELDIVTVVLSNLSGAPVKKINKKLFDVITCI